MSGGGTPGQLVDRVKDGVDDLVITLPGYTAGRFPAMEVFELPFMTNTADVAKLGLTANSRWGDIQVSGQTPIHGGPQALGIYNAMQTVPRADGKREVVSGTSYLQVVTFDDKGPHAQGLLAFSLSSDPASKYSRDQTEAFSKKQWSVLPFTEQQITADPQYQLQTVREVAGKSTEVVAQ